MLRLNQKLCHDCIIWLWQRSQLATKPQTGAAVSSAAGLDLDKGLSSHAERYVCAEDRSKHIHNPNITDSSAAF